MPNRLSKQTSKPIDSTSRRPSLLRRFAAVSYDALLLLGVLFLATAILLPLNAGQAFSSKQYFFPLYLLLVSFVFFGWFWTHGGQTLGLRAWKLKIQTFDHKALTWRQAALRFLGILVTLGIDLIWLIVNKHYIAFHERLSGSTVYFQGQPPS